MVAQAAATAAALREIANKPQSAICNPQSTKGKATGRQIKSVFSTMANTVFRVVRGGSGKWHREMGGSTWLSFILKHIEKRLKSKHSE